MGEHPVVAWYREMTAEAWGQGRARDAKRRGVAYAPIRGAAGHARRAEQALRTAIRSRRSKGAKEARMYEAWQARGQRWRAEHGTMPIPANY